MRVENPAALRFIIDEDLYLLNNDKHAPTIPASPLVETPTAEFKYMGDNKKSFLIIVHYADKEFIDDAHLIALENILKRKELYLDDVAILNIARHNHIPYEEIITYFKPGKLLLMGEKTLPQTISNLVLNQPKQLADCLALYSFSFDEMMTSNENKRVFWEQMKTL